MSNAIVVGPLLGFENGDLYTVGLVLAAGARPPSLKVSGLPAPVAFTNVAPVGENEFWRAEFSLPVPAKGTTVSYSVVTTPGGALADRHGRKSWAFYLPAQNEQPLLAYASCNGFSSAKLARDTDQPYALWERMAAQHADRPFSLLLLGGDQLYADELWESQRCPTLQAWSKLNWTEQNQAKVSAPMKREIAAFYNWLYTERWADESMSLMFASVPSIMMWDDHDIFDGWGSYPPERQGCAVFQEVFKQAARLFDTLQLRSSPHNRLNPQASHRALRVRFRDYLILALDNRTGRTMDRIMSEEQWTDVKAWLAGLNQGIPNLLVMTGVPVVYRSFATVEAVMDKTSWHEELEDDVHDHWSSRPHLAERMRLVMVLLGFLEKNENHQTCKGVILSGDVHVGAIGQIWNDHKRLGLTQIISSGVVHPPPTAFAWAGILLMTSDTPEALGDGEVTTEMLTPFGAPRYLRTRNFATLQTGTDNKLWINWVCEDPKLKPSFAVTNP